MQNSRYIQVHPDAIIEYIWDDNFFYSEDYSIIDDIKNNESSFVFNSNIQDNDNLNKLPQQLYTVDNLINKLGIMDPDQKSFLQQRQYINNSPVKFEKIKLWLPLNYTFPTSTGFYLRVYGLNFENVVSYNFTNFYIDITNPQHLNSIENDTPFRYGEKLWGKSITLYIPSLYDESRNRINNQPTVNSINYNLTNGVLGLSQTSPIFIDFRFLQSKSTVLNEITYITTPSRIISLPQAPEYNNLSVQIQPAQDGDYFIINGLYNGTISGFSQFMQTLEESNKRSYVLYSITVYEENIPQDTKEVYVYKDFWKGIDDYRPVIKYSNTTASIRVDMKLINSIDSSMIVKSAEYVLLGNEVSKYGKTLTGINISNAYKPKLYNSKPDQLILPSKELLNSHLKRKGRDKIEIKFVPFPVLTNVYNIVVSEGNINSNGQNYFGNGQLTLRLKPFDNVIKLNISNKTTDDDIVPLSIPSSDSIVQLVFKSTTTELRIPLYIESNEVDLNLGIVVFKITASDQKTLRKIRQDSGSYYVTITTNGIETTLYEGSFDLTVDGQKKPDTKVVEILPIKPIKIPNLIPITVQPVKPEINITSTNIRPIIPQTTLKSISQTNLTVGQLKRLQ